TSVRRTPVGIATASLPGVSFPRSCSGTSCAKLRLRGPRNLRIESADDERDILPAEAKAVAEHVAYAFFAGRVRDVVEVAVRVGVLVVDRGWQHAFAQGHDTGDQLDGAGGGDQVADHALAAGDRDGVGAVAEDVLDRERLDLVVDFGAGAVSVD